MYDKKPVKYYFRTKKQLEEERKIQEKNGHKTETVYLLKIYRKK